jgi:hypothetical protein
VKIEQHATRRDQVNRAAQGMDHALGWHSSQRPR